MACCCRHDNERRLLTPVSQETNVLGFKGPRKMRVLLPAKDKTMREQREQQVAFKHNLAEMHKKQPSSVIQLKNMTPSWNVESQSYVLNFHGRVTQASVKNFQLIESEDHLDNLSANNNNLKRAQHKEWPPEDASPAKQANVATFWAPSTSGDQPARPGGSLAGAQYNSSIVMQFGRISTHEFTCDVSHPLSILQAFSIALSSFDSKLACE